MIYKSFANSVAKVNASINIKESTIDFGITPESNDILPSPAELFLGSFASCILKNVERFSVMMRFEYISAKIEVNAIRLEKPPRMDQISYDLTIYSEDKNINIKLLKKNIEKFGTIFNTIKAACSITGEIVVKSKID